LGDITKINGAGIEPVWVVTGGSPCQDISIAGKRAGLAGARSGLFMEQVRIVKEMREADKRNGRTGDMVRPRYLVWENVVGAFSSNRGKDFHAVLEEIARIAEPGFSLSGLPEKWKWTKAGAIDGDGWSIAWRTHDAKDWGKTIRDSRTGNVIRLGTPQRRRRISVVADFGGESAAQIQFDRESLSGDIAESGAAGEGPAGAAENGFNPAVGDCLTAWDCQSKRIFDTNGKSPTLQGGVGGGVNNPAIFCMATLAAAPSGTNQTPAAMAFDTTQITSKENGSQPEFGKPCHTLNANAHVPCVALEVPLTYQMNGFGDYRAAEVASSCKQRDFKDSTDLAITNMVVRRLTPMECERLQGFPDGWTDIGDWVKTDKRGREIKVKGSADSPRYKALGNSIALPFWDWMLRRMARYLPEGATLGSLFDGIGGFPLCFERIHGKGTAHWASEIEPFPIAVTKKHFPEEG
jgi:DNA (cytosine-5)-methyltransferase 1